MLAIVSQIDVHRPMLMSGNWWLGKSPNVGFIAIIVISADRWSDSALSALNISEVLDVSLIHARILE